MILPRNDYVLIQRFDAPLTSSIVIPDIAKQKSLTGYVVSTGPKVEEVKSGDTVIFNSKWNDLATTHYHDQSPAHFDQSLHLVQEQDIYARIDKI